MADWGRRRAAVAAAVVAAVLVAGCGGEDRPGTVSVIGDGSGSASVSGATGSVSGVAPSASGTGDAAAGREAVPMGGYVPASDVSRHARITSDVAEINALLDANPIDWGAVRRLYREGEHSLNSDGSHRTLAGFATAERSERIWDDYVAYFNDPAWLDGFVAAAIEGIGPFAGEPDAVRRQGAQKGIQNQVLVAWTLHELVAAEEKVVAGEIDPASGAPHNWDEAWAFYHGALPEAAPYATADKRGADFGRGSAVNEALLAQMQAGLTAARNGELVPLREAIEEIVRLVTVTYLQATIRYAALVEADLEDGNSDQARVHQAEGWAFFRVIEPLVAALDDAAARDVNAVLNLAQQPSRGADAVREALESVYEGLGVSAADIGTLP